jgi:predicted regulator of Ras-like GTPase activity (Roadblock/LC7/MglB family)
LALLTGAALVGLGVLFLHLEGIAALDHTVLLVLAVAVAVLLPLAGFFVGALYKRHEAIRALDQGIVARLKEALDVERKQRISLSRERYQLRQGMVALEGKVRSLTADRLPPAEPAEYQIAEDDLGQSDELGELAATCERLRSELRSRKERMVDLQAELSVAQAEAEEARGEVQQLRSTSSEPPAPPTPLPGEGFFNGESLTEILDGIVSLDGIHVALVADDQGLVVDTAGEALAPDELAAVTGLVAELSPRMTDLLPIGEIAVVALGDLQGRVLEVRYFTLFAARCALAIIREEGAGHPQVTRNAVDAITQRLNS